LENFADNVDRYKNEYSEFKDLIEIDTKWLLLVKRLNASGTNHTIKNKFDSKIQTKIIRQKRIYKTFDKGLIKGYKKFNLKYKNFPGFTEFSNVIFNHDKSKAVVYSSNFSGMTSGFGSIYFLVKRETGWTIICEIGLWIA